MEIERDDKTEPEERVDEVKRSEGPEADNGENSDSVTDAGKDGTAPDEARPDEASADASEGAAGENGSADSATDDQAPQTADPGAEADAPAAATAADETESTTTDQSGSEATAADPAGSTEPADSSTASSEAEPASAAEAPTSSDAQAETATQSDITDKPETPDLPETAATASAAPTGTGEPPTGWSLLEADLPDTTELPRLPDAPTERSPYHELTTATPPPQGDEAAPPRPGGAYAATEAPRRGPTQPIADEEEADRPPRHLRSGDALKAQPRVDDDERRRRRNLLLTVSPLLLLGLLIIAWAVDTVALSGQVLRNVELAGVQIGGTGEDSLSEHVAGMAEDVAQRPVRINVSEAEGGAGRSGQVVTRTYETTAGELGLTLDEEATTEAALDVGRGDMLLVRPFKWIGSFLSSREAPLKFQMSESQTSATLQLLQGTDHTVAVEPTIQLTENGFVAVPGRPGVGLDAEAVGESLLTAVEENAASDEPLEITGQQTEISPQIAEQEAADLATRANELTADGLTLKAADISASVPAQQLRQWIHPAVVEEEGDDAHLDLTFDAEAAKAAAPQVLSELTAEPQNATVVLEGGRPAVRPGRPGATCCGDDAGTKMWDALQSGEPEVNFEVQVTEPEHTTQEVEGWGIREPVGGARAHRSGADIGGPAPGYTTFYDCCASRVTNIHRIAQLIDGAVVAPGASFSINEHVGPRTAAKGFVPAGAIRDGMHVDEIGGGVSQFFTTMFNAAYFAGLDITEYQAHTENFPRYPDGREATGGYPNPGLVIVNNTPYGILIDTSVTGTSVTVTLWSTPHATAEQTGISRSAAGNCQVVTTTRTRTYPDGTTDQDQFRATYRPGEGQFC